jgi:hypothetical protein
LWQARLPASDAFVGHPGKPTFEMSKKLLLLWCFAAA